MENENKNYWPGWETTKLLGHGSYASVYRIERTIPGRSEKEYAALKVITIPNNPEDIEELTYQGYTRDTITEHYRTRLDELIREYTIMLELKGHSNIVYCDDVKAVPHEDGIGWDLYIKMELLKPLKTALGNAPYDEATVIRLGRDLSRALVRCKEKNILHRDIKPQNILVSRAGDFKLSDFGVAKVSEKTVSGTIAGTHEYMAPEVFRGQSYNATADIYSLGIVLYWMMNNRRTPFLPNTTDIPTSSQSEEARNRRFAGESIPKPLNGSEALQAVVLKACAFDPHERYQSPQELLAALEALPLNPPKASKPKSDSEPGPKPEKKKRSPLIPVLAGVAAAVCLGAVLLFGRFGDPAPTPVETTPVMQEETTPVIQTEADIPEETSAPTTEAPTTPTEPDPWEKNVLKADEMPEVFVYPEPVYGTEVTKNQVISVTFLDSLANAPTSAVDVSEAGDGSVLAWFSIYGKDAEMYIAADGGINGKYTRGLFGGYKNLKKISFGGNFHTDYATDMYDMFSGCKSLTDVDINTLDTSSVINMEGMFSSCVALKELNLSDLETGNVTSFGGMFRWCENLKTVDVSTWDTSSATSMWSMFGDCYQLTALDLSSFDTSNVTWMGGMFSECKNLKELDISSFDTSSVASMEMMFYNCHMLPDLDLSHFDVSKVENYQRFLPVNKTVNGQNWTKLFEASPAGSSQAWEKNVLKVNEIPGGVYIYPEPIYGTEVTKNQVISVTFLDTLVNAPTSAVDVSEAGDGSVLAWFSIYGKDAEMYIAAEGGINGKYTRGLFSNYPNLKKVSFGGNFHTDYATDMYLMFFGCSDLTQVDISTLNTENVTNMDLMFSSCTSLTEIDLSGLETGNVTTFSAMFAGCEKLKTVNVSTWDTSSATSFGAMFRQCRKLESVDMSSFDTSNVTFMAFMFDDCQNLQDVDISSFDTANVTTMEGMFRNCHSLNVEDFNEYVSYFDVSKVESYQYFAPNTKSYDRNWDKFFQQQKISGPTPRPESATHREPDPNAPAWEKNVMKKTATGGLWTDGALGSDIPKYKVISVSFLDTVKDAPTSSIDVSLAQDGSVLAWFSGFDNAYEMFIAGEGGINAGTDCQWLFGHYNNLQKVSFNGNFHTDYVENMCSMFGWCSSLKTIDVSTLNTGNVTDMRGMFAACAELTELDLRSMDTKNVRDFGAMFEFCSKLETVDMSTWDTSSAETLSWMFYSCPKIDNVDLSSFDTSNVTDLSGMFQGCANLKTFDISSFNTAKVTTMEEMFAKCTAIGDLDLSHFDISSVENYNYFANQGKTVNGKDWVRFFQNY